jgi:S1-C subfamily serine protease
MNESSSPPQASRKNAWLERLRSLLRLGRRALPFLSGVIAALVALFLYNLLVPGPQPLTARDVKDTVNQVMASATAPPAYSERVYQVIQPSLVLIQAKTTDKDGKAGSSLGSGTIIDDQGDILTSLHVVAGATEIQLMFADGTESAGTIAVKQPENDIAVLKAEKLPKQVIPAVLGNPSAMQIGDEAYAVGNPFGLYGTMTAGVISGFGRSFKAPNSDQQLKGLIQMDAAVNPGNSGGPLLNRDGQVIGVVVGILNPTDQDFFIGIGFAVPINTAAGAAGSPQY